RAHPTTLLRRYLVPTVAVEAPYVETAAHFRADRVTLLRRYLIPTFFPTFGAADELDGGRSRHGRRKGRSGAEGDRARRVGARARALHPLLPLHALQRARRGGRPAGRGEPRRAVGDRDVRGRAVRRRLLRQRHRALPGRRAAADDLPLRGAAVGDPECADGLR